MDYRVLRTDDPLLHWIYCGVLFVHEDDACDHLWLVHGQRRLQAAATLEGCRTRHGRPRRRGCGKQGGAR